MKNIFQSILQHKYFFILGSVILIIGTFFFKNYRKSQAKREKKTTYKVKKQNLKETLTLSGEIDAEEKVTLRFQTSGRLAWVGVKEGDYVKKYQGVASLDKKELKKNLRKYLNTFLKNRWDLDQTRDDYKDTALTDEMKRIIDKSQFDLNNSIIDVELKDLALKYSYLYSPIKGLVTKVESPFAGVNITPAQAEFEIVNPQTVYLSVSADQTEVTRLKKGTKGIIILDSYPNKQINGIIKKISFAPKSGATGTVYDVKVSFNLDNSDYKYRLGMTGDFDIITKNEPNVLAIPLKYIHTEDSQKYIYKLKRGKKEKQIVKLGKEIDSYVEIKKGLKENDIIYLN